LKYTEFKYAELNGPNKPPYCSQALSILGAVSEVCNKKQQTKFSNTADSSPNNNTATKLTVLRAKHDTS